MANALIGAASELGLGDLWQGVVNAIAAGCLPDLLSEAIEAAEALGEQSEAEAAE